MKEKIAIQETYGEKYKHCWGCGCSNSDGIHIKSYPTEDKKYVVCKIIPDKQYTGGLPDNLFGGMIAMIFDCHGTASAAYFNHISKGADLSHDTVIKRYITARLEIDYKKPTPMNEEITVISELEELTEKKAIVKMTMQACGIIRASSRIIAVAVKDDIS